MRVTSDPSKYDFELWIWDADNWSRQPLVDAPLGRYDAALAATPDGRILLFGGLG